MIGSRMDLLHGDESVTERLHDCVHKGARKENEEFLSDQDGQVWKNVRRMEAIHDGKEESPTM